MSTNLEIERIYVCEACEHWHCLHPKREEAEFGMAWPRCAIDRRMLTPEDQNGPSSNCPLGKWPDRESKDHHAELLAEREVRAKAAAERTREFIEHFAPEIGRDPAALQAKLDAAVTAKLLAPDNAAKLAEAFNEERAL
jgi:hypothetical protein